MLFLEADIPIIPTDVMFWQCTAAGIAIWMIGLAIRTQIAHRRRKRK